MHQYNAEQCKRVTAGCSHLAIILPRPIDSRHYRSVHAQPGVQLNTEKWESDRHSSRLLLLLLFITLSKSLINFNNPPRPLRSSSLNTFLLPPRPLVTKLSSSQLQQFGILFHKTSGSFKRRLKTHLFSFPG